MPPKEQFRAEIWEAMPRAGVARALKANPDDARVHARRLALERGKVVVMTVPRLGDERPGEVR